MVEARSILFAAKYSPKKFWHYMNMVIMAIFAEIAENKCVNERCLLSETII